MFITSANPLETSDPRIHAQQALKTKLEIAPRELALDRAAAKLVNELKDPNELDPSQATLLDARGAIDALAHRREQLEREIVAMLPSSPRVVPAPVLVELEYLLRAASDVDAFKAFLDDCAHRAFRIEALLDEDYARVGELLQSYADLRLELASLH